MSLNTRFIKTKYVRKSISRDLFNKWKKQHPEYKERIKTYSEFWNYCKDILIEYVDNVLTNGQGVRLPFYMGDLSLKYVPITYKPIDFEKSKNNNKEINYLNFITNGRVGKIVWSCEHAKRFNKFLPISGFQASTRLLKGAKNALKETPELYFDNRRTKKNKRIISQL